MMKRIGRRGVHGGIPAGRHPATAGPLRIYYFLFLFVLLLLLSSLPAQALYGDTEGPWGLDASFRFIAAGVDYSQLPAFYRPADSDEIVQGLWRFALAGRPFSRFSYEVHVVQHAELNTAADRAMTTRDDTRYQALDGTWNQDDRGDFTAGLYLDWALVKFSSGLGDLTVGRQPITFGKAYFWNPMDVFHPFGPEQLDRDYKPGVDAIRWDIPLGAFSGANLIYAAGPRLPRNPDPGRDRFFDASWYGSSLLVRGFGTIQGWDLALQGGKIYGGYQFGAGAVGEIGPIEVRLEGARFWYEGGERLPFPLLGRLLESHLEAVAGVGHRFESSLIFEFEYLFNGAGDTDHLTASLYRLGRGVSLHAGRHLAGFMVSYELLPIVVGQAVWIYSLSDHSSLIQPSLTISLSDEADVQLSATFFLGDRPTMTNGFFPTIDPGSEFGSQPNIYLVEFKIYF